MDKDLTRFGGYIEIDGNEATIKIPMKSNMDTNITDVGSAIVRNNNKIMFQGIKLQHLDNFMYINREQGIFILNVICKVMN